MVFYLLDDIKKKFGRQLYSLLALVGLSIVTFVLGGVLIFNIVHNVPEKSKQETATSLRENWIDSYKSENREEINNNTSENDNNVDSSNVEIEEKLDKLEKIIKNFDREKLKQMLEEFEDSEFSDFSLGELKRP